MYGRVCMGSLPQIFIKKMKLRIRDSSKFDWDFYKSAEQNRHCRDCGRLMPGQAEVIIEIINYQVTYQCRSCLHKELRGEFSDESRNKRAAK